MTMLLFLLLALQIKHFVFDWLWQPPFMWQNKGTFGHWGGLVHSGLHGVSTWAILVFLFPPAPAPLGLAFLVAISEFLAHYLIDWAKMNINRIQGWKATTHHAFWVLTGADQLAHQLTYLAVAAYWSSLW